MGRAPNYDSFTRGRTQALEKRHSGPAAGEGLGPRDSATYEMDEVVRLKSRFVSSSPGEGPAGAVGVYPRYERSKAYL